LLYSFLLYSFLVDSDDVDTRSSIAISLLLQPSREVLTLDEDRDDMPIAILRQSYDEGVLIEDALFDHGTAFEADSECAQQIADEEGVTINQ
jgi:hypothetical protein